MNSSRFRFELASPADDAELRRRMAEDWMRGSLSLSFRREPSYFAASEVQGDNTQVIKCVDIDRNRIAGMGSRSMKTLFVNGAPQRVGYLSDLRGAPEYRNGTLLARGYRFLRELHYQNPVPFYVTVILEGNESALKALTGARSGLPQYRDMGRILTPAIHLDLPKRSLDEGLRFQQPDDFNDIIQFLHRSLPEKQFSPSFRPMRGLRPEDFLLAIRDSRIVGCCAAWEQREFRQTHLEEYSTGLRLLRPLYNTAARLLPLKRLPEPGSAIPYFYLSFVAIEDNDVRIFRALLRELYRRRRSGPWHYFIAGLHERDPLAEALYDYRRINAAGRLFVVHYEEGAAAYDALDGRVPYLEMATV